MVLLWRHLLPMLLVGSERLRRVALRMVWLNLLRILMLSHRFRLMVDLCLSLIVWVWCCFNAGGVMHGDVAI